MHYYLINQTVISPSQVLISTSADIQQRILKKGVLLSNTFILVLSCFLRKLKQVSKYNFLDIVDFKHIIWASGYAWITTGYFMYFGGETSFPFMGRGRNVFPKYELGAKRLTKNGANWLWGEKSVYPPAYHAYDTMLERVYAWQVHREWRYYICNRKNDYVSPGVSMMGRYLNPGTMKSSSIISWPRVTGNAMCSPSSSCSSMSRGCFLLRPRDRSRSWPQQLLTIPSTRYSMPPVSLLLVLLPASNTYNNDNVIITTTTTTTT